MDFNLSVTTPQPQRRFVPNEIPSAVAPYKIMFLGDFPGDADYEAQLPFSGSAGQLFSQVISQCGIQRSACYIANAVQYIPERKNLGMFHPMGFEFTESRKTIEREIQQFRPNLVVLFGDDAMKFAGFGGKKTSSWRGSILQCTEIGNPLFGLKCLPTYHPSYILKCWEDLPLFTFDIRRAVTEGTSPVITRPNRHLVTTYSVSDILQRFSEIRSKRQFVTLDIEGYVYNITCISFATSPTDGFCVPLLSLQRQDLRIVLRAMCELLADPHVPKGLQNGLYDATVLALTYNVLIRNFSEDTLLLSWEIYPELAKDLGTQCSIWTNEPYYKFERKTDDMAVHYNYCAKDSAVTFEILEKQKATLDQPAHNHYRFNVAMLKPILFTQIKGTRFNQDLASQLDKENKVRVSEVLSRLRQHSADPKFNPNSHQQVKKLLYDKFRLPKQYKKESGKRTENVVSDVGALLQLLKTYQLPVIIDLLLYSRLNKRSQYINMKCDSDGRMRCSYNVVGSETGRLSCSKAANGTGDNLQTVPRDLRKLFLADEGYEYFQCDLAGADGWTVAAECAARGDRRMLEDYQFGLKPAKIIALLFLSSHYFHNPDLCRVKFPIIHDLEPFFASNPRNVNDWSRDQLKAASKFITEEGPAGWLYFTCKRTQHATNYGTGTDTMVEQVLLDSYKVLGNPIIIQKTDAMVLQDLYNLRYPGVKFWQDDCKYKLKNSRGFPEQLDASGHIRKFFGRTTDHGTFRAFLAHQPQANTTYATNLAILNLWNDRANRTGSRLIIEPLHQVHDSMNGQWPIWFREKAQFMVKSYFNNPLTIAGTTLTIPYDGGYGPSWGEAKTPFA
jgi:uracil-DNA glycosylase family 4